MQREGISPSVTLSGAVEIPDEDRSFIWVLGDPIAYDLPNLLSFPCLVRCELVHVDYVEYSAVLGLRCQGQHSARCDGLPFVSWSFRCARVEGAACR